MVGFVYTVVNVVLNGGNLRWRCEYGVSRSVRTGNMGVDGNVRLGNTGGLVCEGSCGF